MIKFIISEYGTRNKCESFKEAIALLNFKPKGHFLLWIIADSKEEASQWLDENRESFDHNSMRLVCRNSDNLWCYEWDPIFEEWDDWQKEEGDDKKLEFTLDDVLDAIKYGFEYHRDAQNNGIDVPLGNKLQWLMGRKELVFVPNEFKEKQDESE